MQSNAYALRNSVINQTFLWGGPGKNIQVLLQVLPQLTTWRRHCLGLISLNKHRRHHSPSLSPHCCSQSLSSSSPSPQTFRNIYPKFQKIPYPKIPYPKLRSSFCFCASSQKESICLALLLCSYFSFLIIDYISKSAVGYIYD